jgi:Flp pilus assembly secretin CpaC
VTHYARRLPLAAAIVLALAGVVTGQQPAPPAAPSSPAPAAPAARVPAPLLLKVQVVFSRYQGEKKVSSQPYTLTVRANEPRTQFRVGVQVPIPSVGPEGKMTVVYKDVGTSIDCSAQSLDDGRFRLDLSLEDSSVAVDENAARAAARDLPPQFRQFRLSNETAVLRDGQTAQLTTAAEKGSGEITKIDVTLTVVK